MTRGLNSSLVSEITSDHVRLIWFVKMELDSGTLYMHDNIGKLNWGSQNWEGLGDFGSITGFQESEELSPFEITLSLSGISSDYISDEDFKNVVLTENFYMRPVTIYVGAKNPDTGVLVADPDEVWAGFTDVGIISLGEENTVSIICENEFIIFTKSNGAVFSDADQQSRIQNGDKFFEFLTLMQDGSRKVVWGGSPVNLGKGGGRVRREGGGFKTH